MRYNILNDITLINIQIMHVQVDSRRAMCGILLDVYNINQTTGSAQHCCDSKINSVVVITI